MTVPESARHPARVAATIAALILLVAWEYGRGPLALAIGPRTGTIVEIAAALAALPVAFSAVRRRRAWWGLGLTLYVSLRIGSGMVLLVLVLLYSAWVRRQGPLPRARVVALGVLALALFGVHSLNLRSLGGDELSRIIGFIGLLTLAVIAVDGRAWNGRIVVYTGLGLGLVFLTVTGMALKLGLDPAEWLETKNAHAIAGIYASPFVLAYLWRHVARRESAPRPLAIGFGTLTAVIWLGLVLTGVNRVATGGRHFAPTELHWWFVLAGSGAVLVHLFLAWRGALRRLRSGSAGAMPRLAGGLLCIVAGLGLSLWPTRLLLQPFGHRGEVAWPLDQATQRLANPRSGVIASSLAGLAIPRPLLVPEARQPGCANALSCHAREEDDWNASSHRFSANPAYRRIVAGLVHEEGVESARLCASCHDPVALLAGEMIAGSEYPQRHSVGVPCIVCHTARAVKGLPVANGHFRLSTVPLLHHLLGPAATQTMMIYESPRVHFEAIADPHLRSDDMCGACHMLEIGGVELRDTFGEFRAARLLDKKGEPMTCRSCHMPSLNLDRDEVPHDHRMLGGNVAIATLGGAAVTDRVNFMAQALELDASIVPASGGDVPRLRLRLINRGSGHGFPTAPLDLVQYWFEARPATAPESGWQRLGDGSLFAERLFDKRGSLLTGHELWKVHRVDVEGARIPVGGERTWEFALPVQSGEAKGGVEVRLRYQRYPEALAQELRGDDAMVDPVDILRTELAR